MKLDEVLEKQGTIISSAIYEVVVQLANFAALTQIVNDLRNCCLQGDRAYKHDFNMMLVVNLFNFSLEYHGFTGVDG